MELVKIIGGLTTPVTVLSGIVHKGAYDAGTDYAVGDAVSYNGASYVMYTDAGAGTAPTDTTKWQVLSSPQQYVESIGELALVNATTDNTISIDQNGNVGTDVATDGAIHIENTGNTGIGLGVYTNIGATADAPLVSIKADNSAFDQDVLSVVNDGTFAAIRSSQIGSLANNQEAWEFNLTSSMTNAGNVGMYIYTNGTHASTTPFVKIINDNASSANYTLHIQHDSTNDAIFIDDNGTGAKSSIVIDKDGNNVAYIFGMSITVDNAGVGGLVCGIDFSGMADTEPLFKFPSATPDADLSTKSPETDAEAGWIPVLYGTTVYAMPVYALS